jgi:hypothetical protein
VLHQWARKRSQDVQSLGGRERLLVTLGEEGARSQKTLTFKRPCYGDVRPEDEKVPDHLSFNYLRECREPDISLSIRGIVLTGHSPVPILVGKKGIIIILVRLISYKRL